MSNRVDLQQQKVRPGIVHKPSLSSLPLQMLLYYNCLFSILFAVLVGAGSVLKEEQYRERVSLSVLLFWAIIEPIRIYFGFLGNLQENVGDMSTFLLLTIFPQIPFVLFFGYIQPVLFPIDPAIGTLMFLFLLAQFFFGGLLLRSILKSHSAQFMRQCELDPDTE